MDNATIELLRRRSGLGLDRECRWTHQGEAITHQRTLETLDAGLEVRDDGEVIVRVGSQWAYVRVEETPYVVRNVRPVGEAERPRSVELTLSDGTRETLDPASLRLRGDSALRCRVKADRADARFSRAAWHNLLPLLQPSADPEYPAVLRLADGEHPIGRADAN